MVENRWIIRSLLHIREHLMNLRDRGENGEVALCITQLDRIIKEEKGRVRKDDKRD